MNLEKTGWFKKVLINICDHPEQKVLSKLNFLKVCGTFKKMQKEYLCHP